MRSQRFPDCCLFIVLAVSCEIIHVQFVVPQIDIGPKIKLAYHVRRHFVLVAAYHAPAYKPVWGNTF